MHKAFFWNIITTTIFVKTFYKITIQNYSMKTARNREEDKMGIIESMRLDGKAIYVTGAASGIGRCAAMAFAEKI